MWPYVQKCFLVSFIMLGCFWLVVWSCCVLCLCVCVLRWCHLVASSVCGCVLDLFTGYLCVSVRVFCDFSFFVAFLASEMTLLFCILLVF